MSNWVGIDPQNGRIMGSRASQLSASHYAAALLGCTMLAGMPAMAFAQDAATPAPAPAASQEGAVIRTIAVAGAQRLEPETIVSLSLIHI